MDLELAVVAETLAFEFGHLRSSIVVDVVTNCVDELPHADSHFIEQAARARLALLRRPQLSWRPAPAPSSLDVSLHDDSLAEEVELTAHLMVAANDSDGRLPQAQVDSILGVGARWQPAVVPRQRPARR